VLKVWSVAELTDISVTADDGTAVSVTAVVAVTATGGSTCCGSFSSETTVEPLLKC